MYPVIAVYKRYVLAVTVGKQPIQCQIPCSCLTLVLLVKHLDPAIFGSVLIADSSAVVRRAVIHKDQLKVHKSLGQDTINASMEILLRIINWDDHTDFRQMIHLAV